MSKKLKFKPVISRVKLNPEQAVLQCPGYRYGYNESGGNTTTAAACDAYTRDLVSTTNANSTAPSS